MIHKTVLSLVLLSSALFAADGEWAQFRGPKRDAVSTETGLLKQWPADGPKLKWKATGLGAGFSSVSIAGGRIYSMGDTPNACELYAINPADQKKLWTLNVGGPKGGGGYPGPRSTPTVDGELVFAIGQYGDIVCAEAATGKEVWRKAMKQFGGKMMSGWGYAESPLVVGDKLICTPGGLQGAVVALNKKNGELIWQSKTVTDDAAYVSPLLVDIFGVPQIIQFTGNSLLSLSPDDGRLLFRGDRLGKTAVIPTPIYHDQQIFVTSGYGIGCNLFKITGDSKAMKAEQVFANTDLVNHHGGVVRVGDYVYGFSDSGRGGGGGGGRRRREAAAAGAEKKPEPETEKKPEPAAEPERKGGLTCMELKTGKVLWRNPSVGKGAILAADGHLYLRGEDSGAVAIFEASPADYKEKGRLKQPDRSTAKAWAHPVIAGGKLYLRDMDVLLCYELKE